jgi:hypothetical protein
LPILIKAPDGNGEMIYLCRMESGGFIGKPAVQVIHDSGNEMPFMSPVSPVLATGANDWTWYFVVVGSDVEMQICVCFKAYNCGATSVKK